MSLLLLFNQEDLTEAPGGWGYLYAARRRREEEENDDEITMMLLEWIDNE